MPNFLHLFKKELEKKQEKMRKTLERGVSNELDNDFEAKFRDHWWQLPKEEKEVKSFAVDSSRATRNYANGTSVYITRAMALGKGGERSKVMQTDAFVSRGSKQKVRGFIRLMSEHTEHKVALKELNKRNYGVLLLDGSLFGRMMHLPGDQPIQHPFMIRYKETLHELIRTCRDEDVLLLGVSKDSSASFLRDRLLEDLFVRELTNLTETLPSEDVQRIRKKWGEVGKHPFNAMGIIRKLHQRYGEKLDRMFQIFTEYLSSRVDFSLIQRFNKKIGYAGFTTPIELGPSTLHFESLFRKMRDQPEAYLRNRFRKSLAHAKDPEAFITRGKKVLRNMCNLPTVVSFHVLFSLSDSPLRIDLPAYEIMEGEGHTLGACKKTEYQNANMERIKEIVRILKAGYVGLNTYNVLLKQVDRKVKLKKREVDQIYEKLLRDFFEIPLIHTRRYRRVRPF